jgi:mutator protein MutT
MKKRFTVIPAVYIIFKKDDEILLLRRFNTGYLDGDYSLPAGHVDGGESAVKAAIREAKEEVGVALNEHNLRLVHTLHRISDVPVKHERIDLFFEIRKWNGDIKIAEPNKCDELRWVKIEKLPKNMVPEVRHALEKISAGDIYSDFNF